MNRELKIILKIIPGRDRRRRGHPHPGEPFVFPPGCRGMRHRAPGERGLRRGHVLLSPGDAGSPTGAKDARGHRAQGGPVLPRLAGGADLPGDPGRDGTRMHAVYPPMLCRPAGGFAPGTAL